MIVVHGYVIAKPQYADAVLTLCQAHARRAREQPGCLSSELYRDIDNPQRLVFLARWRTQDELLANFTQAASREFVKCIGALVAEMPSLKMYMADDLMLSAESRRES